MGMVKHTLRGWQLNQGFANRYRRTKENQSFTQQSLHSMVYRGDQIPHLAFGTVFRVTPSPMNRHTLGISTRYGPVVVRCLSSEEVEFIMNATLEPWILRMREQENNGQSGRFHPLDKWLGCEVFVRHGESPRWLNLGEMVERDLERNGTQ